MKVLVIGATGEYAGHVVPESGQRGATVRALVRDAGKADAARRRGADEVVVGDLRDQEKRKREAAGTDIMVGPGRGPGTALRNDRGRRTSPGQRQGGGAGVQHHRHLSQQVQHPE
jgi:uncharacterized protein YbjT (DUF2867 family)